jgi:hypothetical protein
VGGFGAELDEFDFLVEIRVAAVELADGMGELAVPVDVYSADEEVVAGGVEVGGVIGQSGTLAVRHREGAFRGCLG